MLPNALCPAAASAAMSGRAPRSRRRGSTQHLLVQAPLPVDMPAESSEIACRAAAHPRIGRPGAGKAACLAFRLPPSRLADAQCNVPCPGRRGPSIYRKGRKAPARPLRTPDMCRCEDDAEHEIVLDTARGGSVLFNLAPSTKALGASRGAIPAGGNREPDTGQTESLFTINLASEASAGKAPMPVCPGFTISFSLYVKIAGWIPSRSSSTESLILAQDERWRRA